MLNPTTHHKCAVPNCKTMTLARFLMCSKHWNRVPKELQDEVYKHHQKDQQITGQISQEYIIAANNAIKSVE